MKPVVFGDCFGWLHHTGQARHGVVLCSAFGYDAYCTHRGWRMLAEEIAAAGMIALRFDYPGAGDSAGVEEDPHRFDAWLESIVAAVRWLRAQTGVETVSLVGMRLGATFAALAAARLGDIDGLALLAPVVTGRGYLRELRMQRRKWAATWSGMSGDSLGDDEAHVEAFGFGVHGDDISWLADVDMRRDTTAPARRVLLLDSNARAQSDALARHYASLGVALTQDRFDECDRFLAEPLLSRPPQSAFERVIRWLASGPAQASVRSGPAARLPVGEAVLHLGVSRASERPVVFGPCFGIYCEPNASKDDMPAVLIVNTSAGHHIGDGRLSVLLARRLASQGIASLRMDLGGLGDSTPAAREVTIDSIFSEQACRDAAMGAEWLAARGHRSVIAFGVCSGAYLSLHVCARHPAVVGAYAVNLPKFWHRPVGGASHGPELALWKVYRRSLLDPQKWLRALRGRATNPIVIARGICYRAVRRGKLSLMRWVAGTAGLGIADPDVRALLQALHEKKACVRMVFAELDVGLAEATAHLGADFEALRQCPGIRADILPKLDHALFARQARHIVLADTERWLYNHLRTLCASPPVGEAEAEAEAI
jgi:pimeloyl-ACP methyl ester carboxylesterase